MDLKWKESKIFLDKTTCWWSVDALVKVLGLEVDLKWKESRAFLEQRRAAGLKIPYQDLGLQKAKRSNPS